jgi:hypothetical protein
MTGNFKITLLHERGNEKRRWIIRNCNIHPSKDYDNRIPNRKRFYGLVSFQDLIREVPVDTLPSMVMREYTRKLREIEKLGTNYPVQLGTCELLASNQLETDVFRKFTLDEYIKFGKLLKSLGKRYNKKLDKIIDKQ